MPRAWQWSGVKQAINKTLVSVIDREEEFNFLPYIHTPVGVTPLTLYKECNQYILVSQWASLELSVVAMAAIVALGILVGDRRGRALGILVGDRCPRRGHALVDLHSRGYGHFSLTSILAFVLNCVDHCKRAKVQVLQRQESDRHSPCRSYMTRKRRWSSYL